MERLGVTGGAQARHMQIVSDDACSYQLVSVCRPQIQAEPAIGQPREPAVDLPSDACVGERFDQLLTNIVAARPDAGTESHHEVSWPRAQRDHHRADRRPGHPGRRAAPARVHGRHRAEPPIGQQDRHAVCGHYGHRIAGLGGDDRVGDGPHQPVEPSPCGDDVHVSAVDLNRPDEALGPHADSRGETAPGADAIRMVSPEFEPACGEAVASHRTERRTLQGWTPGPRHPAKARVRPWGLIAVVS